LHLVRRSSAKTDLVRTSTGDIPRPVSHGPSKMDSKSSGSRWMDIGRFPSKKKSRSGQCRPTISNPTRQRCRTRLHLVRTSTGDIQCRPTVSQTDTANPATAGPTQPGPDFRECRSTSPARTRHFSKDDQNTLPANTMNRHIPGAIPFLETRPIGRPAHRGGMEKPGNGRDRA